MAYRALKRMRFEDRHGLHGIHDEHLAGTTFLPCEWDTECYEPAVRIDPRGWVYCAQHGIDRSRKLTVAERHALERGGTIDY